MPRPKLAKRKISMSVTLEESVKKQIKKFGDGNSSKGIEVAVNELIKMRQLIKEMNAKTKEEA